MAMEQSQGEGDFPWRMSAGTENLTLSQYKHSNTFMVLGAMRKSKLTYPRSISPFVNSNVDR